MPNFQATILIVEDEVLLRLAVADNLRDAGFTVFEASNADEAGEVLRSLKSIDLVFTDVHMPGSMDGEALARWIKSERPDLKVLVTSGKVLTAGPDLSFLGKPYVFPDLCHYIEKLLGLSVSSATGQ